MPSKSSRNGAPRHLYVDPVQLIKRQLTPHEDRANLLKLHQQRQQLMREIQANYANIEKEKMKTKECAIELLKEQQELMSTRDPANKSYLLGVVDFPKKAAVVSGLQEEVDRVAERGRHMLDAQMMYYAKKYNLSSSYPS